MAESVLLKSSASPVNASPTSSNPSARLAGPLPLVNVTMGAGGRAQQAGAPKHVSLGPVRGGITRDGKVIKPQNAPQLVSPGVAIDDSGLSPEQLGFCRFLVDAYLKGEDVSEENAKLAQDTLAAIDVALEPPAPAPIRHVVGASSRSPSTSAAAPRRRIAAPPPPVIVEMTGDGLPQQSE